MKVQIKSNRFSRGFLLIAIYLITLVIVCAIASGCGSDARNSGISGNSASDSDNSGNVFGAEYRFSGDSDNVIDTDFGESDSFRKFRLVIDTGRWYGDTSFRIKLRRKPEIRPVDTSSFGWDLSSSSAYSAKLSSVKWVEYRPGLTFDMITRGDTVPHGRPKLYRDSGIRRTGLDKYTYTQRTAPNRRDTSQRRGIYAKSKPNPARMTPAQKRQFDSFMRSKKDPGQWQ